MMLAVISSAGVSSAEIVGFSEIFKEIVSAKSVMSSRLGSSADEKFLIISFEFLIKEESEALRRRSDFFEVMIALGSSSDNRGFRVSGLWVVLKGTAMAPDFKMA